jgi:hypothetical protein
MGAKNTVSAEEYTPEDFMIEVFGLSLGRLSAYRLVILQINQTSVILE